MSTLKDICTVLSVHDEFDVTARRLWPASKHLALAIEVARILKREPSDLLEGSYVTVLTRFGYEHSLHIVMPGYRNDLNITVLSRLGTLSPTELNALHKAAVKHVVRVLQGETLPPQGRKIGGPIIQATETLIGGQR